MPVAQRLRENMESGREGGMAYAVYHGDTVVVDMWAGYADRESERRWRNETMTLLYSATKGLTAIVVATMVEKGYIQYEKRVEEYWPEFGQKDKHNITVEMLLSHQAGLAVLSESVSLLDVKSDPEKLERVLTSQTPVWPPGTAYGYHGETWGLYVDQLVQKADPQGRDIGQIFQEDIAAPFGLDLYMNSPLTEFHRVARIQPLPAWKAILHFLSDRTYFRVFWNYMFNPAFLGAKGRASIKEFTRSSSLVNNPELRQITMSSVSGTGTARGLAKLYAILASGGQYQGRQLLQQKSIDRLNRVVSSGVDQVHLREDVAYGLGTVLRKNLNGDMTFGHPGHGGQVSIADPQNHLGLSFLTSYLSIYGSSDDPRFLELEQLTYQCLGRYKDRVGAS